MAARLEKLRREVRKLTAKLYEAPLPQAMWPASHRAVLSGADAVVGDNYPRMLQAKQELLEVL
jgi:hypothetical protein